MPPAAVTDQRLIELYLHGILADNTRKAYAGDLSQFMGWWGAGLHDLTYPDALRYRDYVIMEYAPASAGRKLTTVRTLYDFGLRLGYLQFNPFGAVKSPKLKNTLAERILSEQEVKALLDAAPPGRTATIFRLLYVTGGRAQEIADLRWQDVKVDETGIVVTLHGKGNKTRFVRIDPITFDMMCAQTMSEKYVFTTSSGRPLDTSQIRKMFKRVGKQCGLPHVSPHWLRHSHGTHAAHNGADLATVRDSLGHASIQTTNQYLHAKPMVSSSDFLNLD